MKSLMKIALITIFISGLASAMPAMRRMTAKRTILSGAWDGRPAQYIAGEIAVRLKRSASPSALSNRLAQFRARVEQKFDKTGWGWISVADSTNLTAIISAFQQDSVVETAEPVFVGHACVVPNDPYLNGTPPAAYAYQWALRNTGQVPPGGTPGADIDAPDAWNITTGDSTVIIAILDSGIPMINGALSHPDLSNQSRIILGPDYSFDQFGTDSDAYGHGTHVAGIAAAETNNGVGIAGVDWHCKLMVVKVMDNLGDWTDQQFYNGVHDAVDYASSHPAFRMVINFCGGATSPSSVEESAISYANTHGIPVVIAAGNNPGGAVDYPAAYSATYSNVTAVSATDQNDGFAWYSSAGTEVCVAAPGGYGDIPYNSPDNVYSTTPNYPFYLGQNSGVTEDYGYLWGTSMAAPFVAGTVGLILSLNPSLTPAEIRIILENSATKVSGMNGQNVTDQYGYGCLDAFQAVKYTLENYGGALSQSITIPQSESWTFEPGVKVSFASNSALIVNGALRSIGNMSSPDTFTSSSGTWGGIQFNNSSSGNTIQYSTIENGTYGVYENNSDVYIANCTIQNNSTGVYCYASADSIFNNTFADNTYGIYASNVNNGESPASSTAWYWGNTFNNNNTTMYLNNAVPNYAFNRGYDVSEGIVATSSNEVNVWTTQPMGYQLRAYNIINCSGSPNVWADNYSYIYMGYDQDGGYNTLCETNYPYLQADNYSTILADNNYFGGGPANLTDGTSTIQTYNPLSSDPNGANCSMSTAQGSPNIRSAAQRATIGSKGDPSGILQSDTSQAGTLFWQAVNLGIKGSVAQAMPILQGIIKGSYDSKYSPEALLFYDSFSNHSDSSQYKNMIGVLQSVANRPAGDSLKPFAIRLLAREAALRKDFADANNYNMELVNNYANSSNQVSALYDLMEYNLVVANDVPKAQTFLSDMVNEYPNDSLTAMAKFVMGQRTSLSGSQKQSQPVAAKKLRLTEFKLGQAYPNPFNPTATITYQLPKDSRVTIKVYDILGREVATLVDGEESAGYHEVTFDGSRLASGVYFYRLTTNGLNLVKKMILMK